MSVKMVFSVYDSKAQAFLVPIFCVTRGVALRLFQAAVLDVEHDFHKFCGDYTLFELGEFDEMSGKFANHATPESVALAVTIMQMAAPNGPPQEGD